MKVGIVGGGVIGLTCAHVLSSQHSVTIVADKFGVETDSIKATAVWHVYLVPETEQVLTWAAKTLVEVQRYAEIEPDSGIVLIRGVEHYRHTEENQPSWAAIPHVFEPLRHDEIDLFNEVRPPYLTAAECAALDQNPVRWGYHIEAPAADMSIYLAWLEGEVRARGVTFERRRVAALDNLTADYDIVVNCSGIGSRMLASDANFEPYKGQYFVFGRTNDSPADYVGDDEHPGGMAYMIPRAGEIMVGGCAEPGIDDLRLTLSLEDTVRRAGLYVPWLRTRTNADQVRAPVVGVRPCRRNGIRLELDVSASALVIHNYGHGGSGFSLSWGCAQSVSALIDQTAPALFSNAPPNHFE
jgi:D-amino-acid oxidase